jgi:hypothetical protein
MAPCKGAIHFFSIIHLGFSATVQKCAMTLLRPVAVVSAFLIISSAVLFVFAPDAHAAVSDWQKGASIIPQTTTDIASDAAKQSMLDLKNTGANYVSFVLPYYQSDIYSTNLAPGWNTPTDATLASAIDYAHSIGLKVALKVHAESYDGNWRAYINPSNRTQWFQNYGNILAHVASIGQSHGAELINLGTELVSMAASNQNSSNTQNWVNLIARVRSIYKGALTYDANSTNNNNSAFENEKKYIGFWDKLDYVGLSVYYQLNTGTSVNELKSAWDSWNKNDIRPFAQSVGKPILFSEIGYRSVNGARFAPWDSGSGSGYAPTEQANLYEALLSYFNDYNYVAGVYWWDWHVNANDGGQGDITYTPQHKPAQDVLKKWFTTPAQPGTPPPTQSASFTSSGTFNPGGTTVGNTVTLAARLTPQSGAASDLLVDVEVYNQSNTKVFQQFYDKQSWSSGETRTFSPQWAPSAPGTYHMTVGVFSNDWSTAYHWNDNAATISVGSTPNSPPPPTSTSTPPTQPPPPSIGTIDVWWPTNGATVSGVQPIKALLQGRDVSTYKMFWQVDGGSKVEMYNSPQDYPHKEAYIDYSTWTWKGSGPYTLTFVAEVNGSTVATQSVNIRTQ